MTQLIKVRATQPGIFGTFRDAGEEFEITDAKQFSSRWMEKVIVEPPVKEKTDKDEKVKK